MEDVLMEFDFSHGNQNNNNRILKYSLSGLTSFGEICNASYFIKRRHVRYFGDKVSKCFVVES